jgi:hypothetical protein
MKALSLRSDALSTQHGDLVVAGSTGTPFLLLRDGLRWNPAGGRLRSLHADPALELRARTPATAG